MSESSKHIELVEKCADWICKSLLDGDSGYMYIEKPDFPKEKRPQMVYGFVPDIIVVNAPKYECIIGEAKTANDIENQHTIDQLRAFIRRCTEVNNALFVFAVPWHRIGLAKSIIHYCCRKSEASELKIEILKKLPG